jgi:L-ascorbate metabolism protein UlaG (beta-lactamase superfamily)
MNPVYVAVAYCPDTGLALTSEDGKQAFYMDQQGQVSPMQKTFPASAVLKHHYMSIGPVRGDATTLFALFKRLEEKFEEQL